MNTPTVYDAKGERLEVGSPVSDGGPGVGIVTEFVEDDGSWWVRASWPAEDPTPPCTDTFLTSAANPRAAWAGDTTLRCDDLTRIDPEEEGSE